MADYSFEQSPSDPAHQTSADPADTADDAAFPWPPGLRVSALDALGETIRRSLFEPSRFFRALPLPSPLGPALVYYVLMSVASAGIMLFWGTFFALFVSPGGALAVLLGVGDGDFGARLVDFLLSPLLSLLGLAIGALVIHVALVVFGGARNGFGATLRALAYTGASQLWFILPAIGIFVVMGWWFVLATIGLREVHGTSTGRAVAAVVVPPLVFFTLVVVLGVLAALLTLAV